MATRQEISYSEEAHRFLMGFREGIEKVVRAEAEKRALKSNSHQVTACGMSFTIGKIARDFQRYYDQIISEMKI